MNKQIPKYKLLKTKKTLHKKAWALMSKYVRISSADWKGNVKCYSCGTTLNWKQANAGHRYHGKLDFDFRNIKVQCVSCNLYNSGNLGEYEKHIIRDHGIEWSDRLCRDAHEKMNNYSIKELEDIIEYLKKLLKQYGDDAK